MKVAFSTDSYNKFELVTNEFMRILHRAEVALLP